MNHFRLTFGLSHTQKKTLNGKCTRIWDWDFFLFLLFGFWRKKMSFLGDRVQTPTDCIVITLILVATSGMTLSAYIHTYNVARVHVHVCIGMRALAFVIEFQHHSQLMMS